MRKAIFVLLLTNFIIFLASASFAQTVGEIQKSQKEIEKEKLLREKIETEKEKPKIEEKLPQPPAPSESKEKVVIKNITITGVTLLSDKEVNDILLPFKNKEITLGEMQKAADMITDAYRSKGYITSRAYLPPQKIKEGLLEISVVEGVTGNINIKGNRYFKTSLIRNKITLKKGDPFNYELLRKGLSKINEGSDRNAKAVIMPGKEAGATDVTLEVKDRLPIHIGFDWDNFGSRFIDKDRYRETLTHNNLLGLDDILTFQYQASEAKRYRLLSLRYLLPVTDDLRFGFLAANSQTKLGKEFKDLNVRGKSKLYSFYLIQTLVDTENVNLDFDLGFDYKDVFNFQAGSETSRDRMRVVRLGLDFDATDKLGRTIINDDFNIGIPNIMSGLKDKDPLASRSGSGGEFTKNSLYLIRLQKMPLDSTILWKNQLQFTNSILTSTEQFQLGGFANVRGYPPAEKVGDRGYAMTWEWGFPLYFIPKDVKVPFSKARLYDAIRFDFLYDWGNVRLKRPAAGEEKNTTLRSAGFGLRVNLPEDLACRIDFSWPQDNMPSDGKHMHTWAQFSKTF